MIFSSKVLKLFRTRFRKRLQNTIWGIFSCLPDQIWSEFNKCVRKHPRFWRTEFIIKGTDSALIAKYYTGKFFEISGPYNAAHQLRITLYWQSFPLFINNAFRQANQVVITHRHLRQLIRP